METAQATQIGLLMGGLLKGSRPLPPTPDSLFDACAAQTFVVFLS